MKTRHIIYLLIAVGIVVFYVWTPYGHAVLHWCLNHRILTALFNLVTLVIYLLSRWVKCR